MLSPGVICIQGEINLAALNEQFYCLSLLLLFLYGDASPHAGGAERRICIMKASGGGGQAEANDHGSINKAAG